MTITEKAGRARLATLLLLALLMLALAAESLLLAPPNAPLAAAVIVIAVKLLPLALFLPALRRRHALSGAWLALLLLLYFCRAVLEAYAPGLQGRLAWLQLALIAACFASALIFTRWQRASDAQSAS